MSGFLQTAYFFGCEGQAGHYLRGPQMRYLDDREQRGWYDRMERLDGDLAPTNSEAECVAWCWRLTGYTPSPYSALSWWDRSVDKRSGSNIIIFVPGHTVTPDNALTLGRSYFDLPSLKREVTIEGDWRERTWKPTT